MLSKPHTLESSWDDMPSRETEKTSIAIQSRGPRQSAIIQYRTSQPNIFERNLGNSIRSHCDEIGRVVETLSLVLEVGCWMLEIGLAEGKRGKKGKKS